MIFAPHCSTAFVFFSSPFHMASSTVTMDSKLTMAKLNAENYFNWKFKMEMFLRREKVWTSISEASPDPLTAAWNDANERALTAIALSVEDSQIQHIRDCKTAKEQWEALKDVHEKDTTGNRVHLLRLIMKERLEEGGDAEAHISRMTELFQKLMALGTELKPEFLCVERYWQRFQPAMMHWLPLLKAKMKNN